MRAKFCSAVAAACAVAFSAGPALADPALWAVKSKTSTVYLFGTVHAVNPAQAWRTQTLDRAFKEASELWLEVPLPVAAKGSAQPFTPEEQQRIGQLTLALGTTPDGPPLTGRLTPAETTAFLEWAFRTDSYRIEVTLNADGSWSYLSDTMLQVRGRPEPFRHRDKNTLVKVAEPTPNPLFLIVSGKKA